MCASIASECAPFGLWFVRRGHAVDVAGRYVSVGCGWWGDVVGAVAAGGLGSIHAVVCRAQDVIGGTGIAGGTMTTPMLIRVGLFSVAP